MLRVRRRNTAWLTAIGALVAIALFSTSVPLIAQMTLLLLFIAAVLVSIVEFTPQRDALTRSLTRAARGQSRLSPQAKEAAERARRRGGYISPDITLVDIGLIASQSGADGMVMRRARSTSKDDDGVRPFVTINVAPESSDRHALVRFEIIDHNGQEQYVYEMKSYLRDGEMNILADHHLPLAGNQKVMGAGDWDLRVFIDGQLHGMHNFVLAPSIRERRNRIAGSEDEAAYRLEEPEHEEIPLSLEELLRSQNEPRQQSSRRNRNE
jgi:hypothetical protein